jgi:hypothetical protein
MTIQRAEPILLGDGLGDPAILMSFAAMLGSYAWSSTKQPLAGAFRFEFQPSI